jgi:hypothetical protein
MNKLLAPIIVEISAGELIDKITILQIKSERMTDACQLRNVSVELQSLIRARSRSLPHIPELQELSQKLRLINERLWQTEDDLRQCEAVGDFSSRFIELARSVYLTNDQRSAIKRQINQLVASPILEEKLYAR